MEGKKLCFMCKEKKEVSEFHKCKTIKDGYNSYCKICMKSYVRKYKTKNKNGNIPKEKKCPCCGIVKSSSDYWRKNSNKDRLHHVCKECGGEAVRRYSATYHNKNKDNEDFKNKNKANAKKWEKNNKERKNERAKKYMKMRRKEDIAYCIKERIRARIYSAVRIYDTCKSASTLELMGCSAKEYRSHLKSTMVEGMTWEAFMNGEIHIDHIKPICSFNLLDEKEQQKCFHYTNTQLLWAKDNLQKGAKQ